MKKNALFSVIICFFFFAYLINATRKYFIGLCYFVSIWNKKLISDRIKNIWRLCSHPRQNNITVVDLSCHTCLFAPKTFILLILINEIISITIPAKVSHTLTAPYCILLRKEKKTFCIARGGWKKRRRREIAIQKCFK